MHFSELKAAMTDLVHSLADQLVEEGADYSDIESEKEKVLEDVIQKVDQDILIAS